MAILSAMTTMPARWPAGRLPVRPHIERKRRREGQRRLQISERVECQVAHMTQRQRVCLRMLGEGLRNITHWHDVSNGDQDRDQAKRKRRSNEHAAHSLPSKPTGRLLAAPLRSAEPTPGRWALSSIPAW